jgi:hypothetical protein
MLQFFSASTNIVNSKRAITECIENALHSEPDLNCSLILIYSGMGHNFKDLLTEARKLSPGARIAGGTCSGIIGKNGSDESMTALAIMAVKGPENEFAIVSGNTSDTKNPFDVITEMARELKNKNPGIKFIQLIPPMFFWIPYDTILQNIKNVFGQGIPVFGCVSIDNVKGVNCFQFCDDQVIERGAVMIGYADPTIKFINHANHGFGAIEGMPFRVTRSESNRIFELNNKPAWPLLTETLGVPEGIKWVELILISCLATELPERFSKEYGNKYIITAAVRTPGDSSFETPTIIKEGTNIFLSKRDEKMMFDGVKWMINNILEELNDNKPIAVIQSDCGLRGKLSLNKILKDELINNLQGPLCKGESIPWLGMYGGGEFAMLGGEARYHALSSSLFVMYR